jgi:putative transposase
MRKALPVITEAAAFSDRFTLLLLANRGAHTAPRLTIPATGRCVFVPPYCPALNPIERVWRDLKDAVAWQQFLKVDAQQDEVAQVWRADDAPTLQSLTGYTDLVEAVNALLT